MKIFWSWQADTLGKIGRFFVRDALARAIKALKQAEDIEEPSDREARQALHLDHDRQGVPGSPALAPTIFRKIEHSAVFVADVTLVAIMEGEAGSDDPPTGRKKLINSNVAIEYGYASHALGDEAILMVQNTFYGDRDELPFDLKYKAGPIQFNLAPDASKQQIADESAKLEGTLRQALRPYIGRPSMASAATAWKGSEETPATQNPACFWERSEVLARFDDRGSAPFRRNERLYEYRFDEARAFYLRLMPIQPRADPLRVTALSALAESRQVDVLTRAAYGTTAGRNRFGAIVYEVVGDATTPHGFTQLFRSGEIWGVTRDLFAEYQGDIVIPMASVSNFYLRVLKNYIEISQNNFGSSPPYNIELGAVGLRDVRTSLPGHNPWNEVSQPIYENELRVRKIINNASPDSQRSLVSELVTRLYGLAGISLTPPTVPSPPP